MRIKDTLTRSDLSLTRSEAKIVQVLLADYPLSGLGTASSLARRAGTSDPTVARLVVKLGFSGFPELQGRLLAEVEAGLRSPLLMMEAKRMAAGDSAAQAYLQSAAGQIEATALGAQPALYQQAAEAVMGAKGRVLLLGGRFSRHVAGMLGGYLRQFRPNVIDLGALSVEHVDLLADLGKRDLLVVFDYRRYQTDVVRFAEQAAGRGVGTVLFTDLWLSPIASFADLALVAPIEVASPYDTLAPAVLQIEALVAQTLALAGTALRSRVERIEAIRAANGVTIDKPPAGTREPAMTASPAA